MTDSATEIAGVNPLGPDEIGVAVLSMAGGGAALHVPVTGIAVAIAETAAMLVDAPAGSERDRVTARIIEHALALGANDPDERSRIIRLAVSSTLWLAHHNVTTMERLSRGGLWLCAAVADGRYICALSQGPVDLRPHMPRAGWADLPVAGAA